jgi:putative hemin transport protein
MQPQPLLTDSGLNAEQIAEQWAALRAEQPQTRSRDAADKLGVSEAQLLATRCGQNVTRLAVDDWGQFITEMGALGQVMALTRNDDAVSEKDGRYRHVEIFRRHTQMGQVLDEGIDLRLFLDRWHMGFAVAEEIERGLRRSFQFFSADGTAVHKTYLRGESDVAAFESLTERHRSADQSINQPVEAPPPPETERPDEEIDVAGFRTAWSNLQDTHDFIRVTRQFGVTRTQALRLAEPEMAWQVTTASFRLALELAAASGGKIMVFVSNPGCIQIHSGPVVRVKTVNEWLNVLDPGFNLHVHEPGIASAWVVRKPTVNGVVTGVEFYDNQGRNIAILHGKRVEGNKQPEFWPELCSQLPRLCPR